MVYPELNDYCEELCLEGESWLPVKGWEGLYAVSSLGRVKREASDTPRYGQAKVLKAHPAGGRYPKVVLVCKRKGREKVTRSVHRLVAEAFVSNPEGKPQVNHLNSDIMDARATNLEWTTQAENIQYAFEQGRKVIKKGTDSNFCKYPASLIKDIYIEAKTSGKSQREVGEKYGVHQTVVSSLLTKKTWRHLTDKLDAEVH